MGPQEAPCSLVGKTLVGPAPGSVCTAWGALISATLSANGNVLTQLTSPGKVTSFGTKVEEVMWGWDMSGIGAERRGQGVYSAREGARRPQA